MKTLKLDSSYRPVQVIDALDAFGMVYLGRANLVEVYDDQYFHSINEKFPIPCIISVNCYVRKSTINLRCNRKNIFWRDRNICQYCSKKYDSKLLTLDHVTPRSKGGPKTWENIVTCCHSCNQKKGDKLPIDAGMKPIKPPKAPSPHIFHTIEDLHDKWLIYLAPYK